MRPQILRDSDAIAALDGEWRALWQDSVLRPLTLHPAWIAGIELDLKQAWEPIRLTKVGDIADVVKGGGGKISAVGSDPGDTPRKPKGQG